MPPPWSFLPLMALKDTLTSTSLALVSLATQRLKTALGLSAVCARAKPLFDGAVSSATTFQILLLAPLLVWVACHPSGTLPTSPLAKRKVRPLPLPAWRGAASIPASTTPSAKLLQRIVRSPSCFGSVRPAEYRTA